MSSSGAYSFEASNASLLDEAWERLQKDPAELTLRHIVSARRSMDLMFKEWETKGVRNFAVDLQTTSTTVSMASFTPASGTLDLLEVSLRRDGVDVPMQRISRSDFESIPDKTVEGRPDRFYVDRSTTAILVYVWPLGENTTDTIRYWRMRRMQDVGTASATPDVPPRWGEAVASGLAAKLARKWAPNLVAELKAEAQEAFYLARQEDREKAPVTMNVRYK